MSKPVRQRLDTKLSAFTLMELMVVLVLIAILSALIIPEMKGTFQDALLRSTGRELVNVIELTSSRAVSLNQTLRIKLDPITRRYEIERRLREGSGDDYAPIKDTTGSEGTLDKRISIQVNAVSETPSDSDHPLTFYPDGTADATQVTLQDKDGFRLSLLINPITSRVTIAEPAHE